MPLPLRQRTVFFYDLRMTATTRAAVQRPSHCGIAAMLKGFASQTGSAKLPLTVGQSSHTITYLMDWQHNPSNNSYELLINKANAKLADIALRDLQTTILRRAGKRKTDGIEQSAHLVVRPNANDQSALVLLTMNCGVSMLDVERVFRLLTKAASKMAANRDLFYFDDPAGSIGPDGKRNKYKVGYRYAVDGYMGQTMDDALRTGEFTSMELIAMDKQAFDSGGNLQIEERSLKIEASMPSTVTGASIKNGIRFFQNQPDAHLYDKLRLNFKSASGRPATTILGLNDLDAAFTRREIIEFDSDVDSHDLLLSPTIMGKMRSLI